MMAWGPAVISVDRLEMPSCKAEITCLEPGAGYDNYIGREFGNTFYEAGLCNAL